MQYSSDSRVFFPAWIPRILSPITPTSPSSRLRPSSPPHDFLPMGTSRAPQRAAGIRILSSSPRPNKMDEDKRPSALLDHAILVAFSNLKTRPRLPFVAFSNLKIRVWRLRVHVNRPQDTGSEHPQTRQSSSVAFSNLNTYPHHGHASSDFRDALKLFVAFSNLKVAFGNLTTAIGNLKTAIGNLKDASSSLKDAFNGPRRSRTLRVPSITPLKASRTCSNPKDASGSLTTAFHSLKDTFSNLSGQSAPPSRHLGGFWGVALWRALQCVAVADFLFYDIANARPRSRQSVHGPAREPTTPSASLRAVRPREGPLLDTEDSPPPV
ncbi:hypothetical protein BD626DRAFT_635102 [Schizophyllum amplum]|uniref:Uncharacterized protein n=1 Tax=Schizophyllum amplum TaxID=97359 RepID=A0A550BX71_9AGAR|nr:hypothetical protein BD626DRAFT_635102 [Auriculariopsis ampla]